jgi:hypothetical protein
VRQLRLISSISGSSEIPVLIHARLKWLHVQGHVENLDKKHLLCLILRYCCNQLISSDEVENPGVAVSGDANGFIADAVSLQRLFKLLHVLVYLPTSREAPEVMRRDSLAEYFAKLNVRVVWLADEGAIVGGIKDATHTIHTSCVISDQSVRDCKEHSLLHKEGSYDLIYHKKCGNHKIG